MATALGPTTESRGVGRFLAAHEECGSGFQITRTGAPGRPRLRLLCQGCGQRAAYAAGDASLLGEEEHVDVPAPPKKLRRRRGRKGFSAADPESAERPTAAADGSGSALQSWLPAPAALPWWVPNAYILLVIAIGLGLIAFGVSRQQEGGGGDGPAFGSQKAPESEPAPATPPATTPAPAPADAQPAPQPRPPVTARAKRELDRVAVLDRFSIGVPGGWSRGESGGAAVFRPGSDAAEVRIFLQPGAEPLNRLERDAARFLRQEYPGASVGRATALRLGPSKARELVAGFKGGTETAVVVSADSYSYLLLGRVDSRAPASLGALTLASLRSFRTQ